MENNNENGVQQNVKVFGTPTAVAPETIKTEAPKTTTETPKEPVETPKPNVIQGTDAPKGDDKPIETPKADDKPKVDAPKGKEDKKSEGLKISFDNDLSKPTEPKPSKQETVSVTEEVVSKFIKDNYNLEFDKISDLSKKEELPESVAVYKKFVEDTGRTSLNDFYNAQKDWNKESKEDTIKEFYKYEYPDMSDDDIDTQIELVSVSKDDEDELESRELSKRKLDFSKEYSKALSFMNKKSKEYSTPLENAVQQKPPTPKEIAEAHQPYWDARDKSLEKLNEVKLTIEGIGEINLDVTDEHKSLISKHTETQEAFFKRWQDDKGMIDTDKSSLDMMWSIPEIRQSLIKGMLEKAHALTLENFSKENRNVDLDKIKVGEENQSGASVQVVGDANRKQEKKMGQPLF